VLIHLAACTEVLYPGVCQKASSRCNLGFDVLAQDQSRCMLRRNEHRQVWHRRCMCHLIAAYSRRSGNSCTGAVSRVSLKQSCRIVCHAKCCCSYSCKSKVKRGVTACLPRSGVIFCVFTVTRLHQLTTYRSRRSSSRRMTRVSGSLAAERDQDRIVLVVFKTLACPPLGILFHEVLARDCSLPCSTTETRLYE